MHYKACTTMPKNNKSGSRDIQMMSDRHTTRVTKDPKYALNKPHSDTNQTCPDLDVPWTWGWSRAGRHPKMTKAILGCMRGE